MVWRMILVGILGGIIIWGGLNTGMEWTNRTEFCISCHEMTIPYEEYKKTIHYKNRTGTSVQCADCHIASSKHPADYMFKSFQKLMAARDVIGHISGIVDTPEKFETHRLTMAQRVWDRMKERDSKECRNCHDFKTMDPLKQKDRSVVKHEGAQEDGKTCIDCHKGIAHKPVHNQLEKPADQPATSQETAATAGQPQMPAVQAAPKTEEKKEIVQAAASAAPVTATAKTTEAAPAAAPVATAKAPTPTASTIPALDWEKAAARKIKLFYPGQAAFEWVMNKDDHSSADDIVKKKRPCAKCHEGDADDVGAAIVAGKPVGASKTVLEPNPPAGKVGHILVTFRALHDDNNIYFRFEWTPPAIGKKKLDSKNEVKVTMMFDGGSTVEGAEVNGCWGTCHTDLRTMKDAADEKKTKYIKDADLGSGVFMDLIQFRSGESKVFDGYVADKRVMEGGKGLIAAEGKKEGNKWVVTFQRALKGGGKGDHAITPDKIFNFGFAIHEDYTNARYHYVSLGYQFGLDKEVEGVKQYYNVIKQ